MYTPKSASWHPPRLGEGPPTIWLVAHSAPYGHHQIALSCSIGLLVTLLRISQVGVIPTNIVLILPIIFIFGRFLLPSSPPPGIIIIKIKLPHIFIISIVIISILITILVIILIKILRSTSRTGIHSQAEWLRGRGWHTGTAAGPLIPLLPYGRSLWRGMSMIIMILMGWFLIVALPHWYLPALRSSHLLMFARTWGQVDEGTSWLRVHQAPKSARSWWQDDTLKFRRAPVDMILVQVTQI